MNADDVAEVLRSRGQRMTPARRLVWEAVSSGGHLTANEVAERVGVIDASVNLSSVYRSLTLFADLGLVRESNLGVDGASRWEPIHTDDHVHLVCANCGSVSHHGGTMVEEMKRHLGDDHGFTAETIELVATGRCGSCRSSS